MLKKNNFTLVSFVFISLGIGFFSFKSIKRTDTTEILTYIVDGKNSELKFFWKDRNNKAFGNFYSLNKYCIESNSELVFAMNGGMYLPDQSPQGIYIEDFVQKSNIDTMSGYGNFYLKPNGVFYITKHGDGVVQSLASFRVTSDIRYATQSGPMLLVDGKMHPAFKKGSNNLHIRNGVGILPNSSILFAMSKTPISFYDFANFFKSRGCTNALYLDGYVSRTYLPSEHWIQTDGAFGVIIAEIKSN